MLYLNKSILRCTALKPSVESLWLLLSKSEGSCLKDTSKPMFVCCLLLSLSGELRSSTQTGTHIDLENLVAAYSQQVG